MAFDEIIAKMQRGKKVGNIYFQSLLKNGSKNFPFAEFIYEPSNDRRVPTRQKDIYHLALLTLNLGAIKRQRFIGGNKRFPSWIRRDPSCVVLPHLIFRNGAHRVALCEASDDHGGIAKHQDLARDNAMLGMVVNAEITAPSLAIFSEEHMKLEILLNSSASISVKLRTRSRRTNSGFFTAVFFDLHLGESHLVKW